MNKITVLATVALLTLSTAVLAAKPTDIKYTGRKTTFFGTEYKTYVVRCSDGLTKSISSWGKEEWCVGHKQKRCYKTQIAVAKAVCS